MVGWHQRLDGYEFEQASGVGDGQGSLVCCSSWGHKKSDTTKWLNWTDCISKLEIAEILNQACKRSLSFPKVDNITKHLPVATYENKKEWWR